MGRARQDITAAASGSSASGLGPHARAWQEHYQRLRSASTPFAKTVPDPRHPGREMVVVSHFQRNDPGAAILHREGGPALIENWEDGCTETFYRRGLRHRADGPARITTYQGEVRGVSYYIDGRCHREDGPAIVETRPGGSHSEHYYRDGERDREDGPALIVTNADGQRIEKYYRAGKLLPQ